MRSRSKLWVAAVFLLLLGAAAIWIVRTDIPIGDIADVIAQGGEKQLRDPLRPARGAPRVLVLALDGVGADEFRAVIDGGSAPQLAALFGEPTDDSSVFASGYLVPDALSILPSTTYAAWASIFTGEPPGVTGITGNEWFAREEGRFYAPAPVSVTGTEDAVSVYADDLVGQALRVPTLFERADVRAYVSLASVYRGADLLTTPDPGAFADLAGAAIEGVVEDETVEQEGYEALDREAVASLVETLREHGVADLQVVYFPGVDLYTHVADSALVKQVEYIRDVVDPEIGNILREYDRQGALDDLSVVIVSDHGHTPVVNDDRHSLGAGDDDEPTAVLESLGLRVRPGKLRLDDGEGDHQAVVAYQGAIAYVYLADRSTCPAEGDVCDWTRPPRLEEDVLPVAAAFHEANTIGARVPELRGTLDLIFARAPSPVGGDAAPFEVFDGTALVPVGAYLEDDPRPDLVELEGRLADLGIGPLGHRAGDVLLLARSGLERPIEERFYFSSEYHSWHGSASAQDSRITLAIASRAASGADLRARLAPVLGERPNQLDVVPMILELLRGPGGGPIDAGQ